jgi:nucleotide-binding universal stress UspA family protein
MQIPGPIVCAVDRCDAAVGAIEEAALLSREREAQISILHVVDHPHILAMLEIAGLRKKVERGGDRATGSSSPLADTARSSAPSSPGAI